MNKTNLLLSLFILVQLSACAPPREDSSDSPAMEVLNNWEIKSDLWTLNASKGLQQENSRRLQSLSLQVNSWDITAPQGTQKDLTQAIIQLKNVSGQNDGMTINTPKLNLDMDKHEIHGETIEIKQPYWQLSAKSFNTSLSLDKWHLHQVKGTF